MTFFAILHNRRGQRYLERGDLDAAALSFARAIDREPMWAVPWYNLGFVYKLQRRWRESLDCNLSAADLDPQDEAAWWNAGIAATALGAWDEARRAWTAFGISLPPGEGEIVMQLGLTPIRINPDTAAEVVWCRRIDPARAIIQNVPLAASGHRYGDLLLHDGAPEGTRILDGQEVPVFNALQLLRASDYGTYAVRVRVEDADDVRALVAVAETDGLGVEDWDTIRRLCAECSRGNPGAHAAAGAYTPGQLVTLAVAARGDDELRTALTRWAAGHETRAVDDITLLLPGSQASAS